MMAGLWLAPTARGQSVDHVPGVVVSQFPTPSGNPISGRVYVSDPCLIVRSNGDYIVSHAQFGADSNSGTNGTSRIFRSTDKGLTWQKLNGGNDVDGILRGSLFEHNGALYMMGGNKDAAPNQQAVVIRSTDNGASWSSVSFASRGAMPTPDNLLEHGGRLWLARTRNIRSMPVGSDPFVEASWSDGSGFPALSGSWLSDTFSVDDNFIGEGQVVVSPHLGIVFMSKVRIRHYAALGHVHPTTRQTFFNPDFDFIRMEGGEKKFAVRYDAVSGKYYMLSNPILPAHYGSSLAVDLIRNTAALSVSTDLRNWEVVKIFLYSPNIDYEGYQYFNFDFDGNDLAIAARTAFDVGGNRPPRGHDSNLLTFHRIEDFRTAESEHVLRLEGGQLNRHETTQDRDAPLGNFVLGNVFDGAPLSNPMAFRPVNGIVYIQESGGRILRFDLLGNFLGTLASLPGGVTVSGEEKALPQPPKGEKTWKASGSGQWDDPRHWHYWNKPGTPSDTAIFGSAATGSSSVVTVPARGLAWNFNQAGNFEGWSVGNSTHQTISGGTLKGKASTNDPYVQRVGLNVPGSEAPEVRVRMRAAANTTVEFQWAHWIESSFSPARRVTVDYTGNGEFQELVFPMKGRADWEGHRITGLRVDPLNGSVNGLEYEIDDISIPMPVVVRGLRFQSGTTAYTLDGVGASLRIESDSGPGRIEVLEGSHQIDLSVALGADTDMVSEADATLTFVSEASPRLNGHTLRLMGHGKVNLNGPNWTLHPGRLRLSEGATLNLANGLVLSPGSHLEIENARLQTHTGGLRLPAEGGATVTVKINADGQPSLSLAGDLHLGNGNNRLQVILPPGFTADRGDAFPILAYGGGKSGEFEGLPHNQATNIDGHLFNVEDSGGGVSLTYLGLSFEKWIEPFGLPAEEATPEATPAGDDVSNLVKYVLGIPPLQHVLPAEAFRTRTETVGGEDHLIIEMERDPRAVQHRIQVQVSHNLIDWQDASEQVTVLADTPEWFRAGLSMTEPRAFLRLKIRLEDGIY